MASSSFIKNVELLVTSLLKHDPANTQLLLYQNVITIGLKKNGIKKRTMLDKCKKGFSTVYKANQAAINDSKFEWLKEGIKINFHEECYMPIGDIYAKISKSDSKDKVGDLTQIEALLCHCFNSIAKGDNKDKLQVVCSKYVVEKPKKKDVGSIFGGIINRLKNDTQGMKFDNKNISQTMGPIMEKMKNDNDIKGDIENLVTGIKDGQFNMGDFAQGLFGLINKKEKT